MRKFFKITAYLIGGGFLLLILIIALLQSPWGQNLVREKVVAYLQEKLGTAVAIGDLHYRLPNHFELENVYLEDRQKDTLLYLHQLEINWRAQALLGKKIKVKNIALSGLNAHIYRCKTDSNFNYQFIIDAFSGNETDTTNTNASGSGFSYDIGDIKLNNIRFRYDDSAGGILFSTRLRKAYLQPILVDVEHNKYVVNNLELSQVASQFISDSSFLPPEAPDTSATGNFQIAVHKIRLNHISFSMLSKTDSMYFSAEMGKMTGQLKAFDLLKENIETGKIAIEKLQSKLILGKNLATGNNVAATADTEANNWTIFSDGVSLNQIRFAMDDPNEPALTSGMDYSHMDFRQLFLKANQVYYCADSSSAKIIHLACKEKSGFNLMDLRAHAIFTNKDAILKNLFLQTPNSLLQDYLAIRYPSLDALSEHPGKINLNLKLKNSKIGINDLLLFTPEAEHQQLLPYKNEQINLVADIKGSLNDLQIDKLYLKGLDGTVVDVNGTLSGLPDADKLAYRFQINRLQTRAKTLAPFISDSLKQNYRIPQQIAVTGDIRGTISDYYPNLAIKTTDGNLNVHGKLLMSPGTNKEQYNLALQTQKLDLGDILKQDSVMGIISATLQAEGKSFNPKMMKANIGLHLKSASIMGYDYHNIRLVAGIKNEKANLSGYSADSNLNFKLIGTVNLENEYPAAKINIALKNANLHALHLFDDSLTLAGDIQTDFASLNPDYPAGSIYWLHPKINYERKEFHPDSIYLISQPQHDSLQHIRLNLCNLVHITGSGVIPLSQMGTVLETHINRHYFLADSLTAAAHKSYYFSLKGQIQYQRFLKRLYPKLQPFAPIQINGGFNKDTLAFNLKSAEITYDDNILDSLKLQIKEDKNSLKYLLSLKNAQTSLASLWYPYIGGIIRHDSIYALVNIDDSLKKKQFTIGGVYFRGKGTDSSMNYFRLFKGLRFNYEIWKINPDNRIAFGTNGWYIKNLTLSHDTQLVDINSQKYLAHAPLDIEIKNFSLANVTKMFSKDTLLADGILNAKGNIDLSGTLPKINASVFINKFRVFNQPLGDFSARIRTQETGTLNTFASLQGKGNNLQLYGQYYLAPKNNNDFDLTLRIQPLKLATVQALSFGALKKSSGNIHGNLNLKGVINAPIINGTLYTDQLATNIAMLNASFKLPKDSIVFSPHKMTFNKFRIEDQRGNPAFLNGVAYTRDFTKYYLDFNFNAQRWQALNSTKADNPAYYGKLIFSSNVAVKGIATAPKITGNIIIHDSTNLHYAMLDETTDMEASNGIVQFVDSRDSSFTEPVKHKKKKFRFSPSTQLNVNLAVDKNATFTVLVDPATGDELQVRGEAALNAFMDPSGTIGLTGTYKIDDGYYELNYNLLHRKFDIQKESTITLSGNPYDAVANITAIYNADIAPYDLVQDVAPPDQLIYYKQSLPFQVILKMKGKVMQPEISFDIKLPEDQDKVVSSSVSNLVQAKLNEIRNNPSELNKQVFAVLILNKFLGNDPFAGSGLSMADQAKQSVSRFLSDQLNRIAGHLVKGVDLNFGINNTQDYSTGTKTNRTDLNISASKSLFNERLKITVGNDFNLSENNTQRQQSSLIPGNISIAYLLTKDGRYQANAYRTNDVQNIADGYVIETGLKFKISLTYNKFKYLFINRKKYFQKLRERRKKEASLKKTAESSKQNSASKQSKNK